MNKAAFIFFWGVKSGLETFGKWLMTFGAFGLFTITLLDSAFVPLPSGPDLIMITLSVAEPSWMPVYALAATVGSTVGCTLLYLAARRAGMRALRRVGAERRERLENLLGRYDMLAVMIPSVLPPPFPFKPFVLSAGVFKLKIVRFVIAIFVGRAIRFLVEGWLAVELGDQAWPFIMRHGLKVLIAVGVIFAASLALKFYRLRSRNSPPLTVDEIQK
ncbi:MAG TPA: VTT domain-containing protein [Blastocatellia bacterium]|jgi:membrane protein YqaA with SNARE-associated domain|nr:VTT domain-containing protein [Blastocatellia bacterium]